MNLCTAVAQITMGKTTANTRGIRLGKFATVNDIIDGEMEIILSGEKSAKEGLDEAVKKGNAVLKEFASMHKQ